MQAKPYLETGEPDDGRMLLPIECAARGLPTHYFPEYSLDRRIVLTDFNQPAKNIWPPYEERFFTLMKLAVAIRQQPMPDLMGARRDGRRDLRR
jgi:hypothetical protein